MRSTGSAEEGGAAASAWPVVVVGAGAAGLLAALFAARAGARVLLLETKARPGAKIRVSGGGRCNVLPSAVSLEDFHTAGSRHALRNVLFSWPLDGVKAFFERDLRIPLKTEATGKVFPVSERPQDVVEALLREIQAAGVTLAGDTRVTRVRRLEGGDGARFELATAAGGIFRARRAVLATGGLSLPRTGSDGGGLEIARALGHALEPTYPALVPLIAADTRWRELAGVSARVRLRARRGTLDLEEREGDFLFTHRGFSGPVVLDLSRHVTTPPGEEVALLARWGGGGRGGWDAALRQGGKALVATLLAARLPRRLADRLLEAAQVPLGRRAAELAREERLHLLEALDEYRLPVSGSEGYATAEVTGGGVALGELSPRTLESRKVPGLHFAGEMLDATGRIGGYNFLWAWVTGRKAGEGAAMAEG